MAAVPAVAAALIVFAVEWIRLFGGGAPGNFLTALFYAALPLAGIAFGSETKKIAPKIVVFYGAAALLCSFFSPRGEGLMLNWNWNATLVVLALPFFASSLFPGSGKKAVVAAGTLVAAFFILTLLGRRPYFPFGSVCAAVAAAVAVMLTENLSRRNRRIVFAVGTALFCAAFFGLLPAAEKTADYRVQLWRGTRDLIASAPVFGVGAGNFEDRIAEALPPEIWTAPFPANRHLHPHDEMLFFLAVSGLAGGAFFLLLTFAVVDAEKTRTRGEKLLLWGFFLLFFHGVVDAVLGETPTAVLFYFFAGALMDADEAPLRVVSGAARAFFACGIAALGIALAVRETVATLHYRRAHEAFFRDGTLCRRELSESLAWKTGAPALYLAGCDAIRNHRFADAGRFFGELHETMRLGGFIHSNHFAGRAALMQGDTASAIRYFVREEKRFPFSIVNAFWMARLAESAGYPESLRREAEEEVDRRLALRGLSRADLPEILRRPERDDLLVISAPIPAPAQK
ncbi:MAG: O-antigen ligase family protein [Victivallaceae bacterium]|nr:O-antigen ligase family protein [Victivallaceae bacterium]